MSRTIHMLYHRYAKMYFPFNTGRLRKHGGDANDLLHLFKITNEIWGGTESSPVFELHTVRKDKMELSKYLVSCGAFQNVFSQKVERGSEIERSFGLHQPATIG